jgi:threonine/homoserine/homoserine lactone efflux protein
MNLLKNLPQFIATAFFLAMIPGQGTAMIMRQTLLFGSRVGITSLIFYLSGFVIWGLLSAVGLSAIFTNSDLAYEILKWLGVSFLSFLSLQTLIKLRKGVGKFELVNTDSNDTKSAFKVGITTSMTNVKAAIFAVAFIPAFVPEGFNLALGISILGLVWALTSFVWYLILLSAINKAANLFMQERGRKMLTLISAIGLLLLAVLLAAS